MVFETFTRQAFLTCLAFLFLVSSSQALIEPEDVLILVNKNSPTSVYIADLYRHYHPEIPEKQVLELEGLIDCSGPKSDESNEIISRVDYDRFIAEPLRNYLIENDLVNKIRVIVTTAGMPYRIAQSEGNSYLETVVVPGGSTPPSASMIGYVDAASVESELTVLFQNDPESVVQAPIYDRIANPFQGYENSGADCFERDILNRRESFRWQYPRKISLSNYPPIMEGSRRTVQGIKGREFCCGDMYLTCRLDGPKNRGESAIFSVRQILERASKASSAEFGVNAEKCNVVFDDAPLAGDFNYNQLYNLNTSVDYLCYTADQPQPPDVYYVEIRDDFEHGFAHLTGVDFVDYSFNTAKMLNGHGLNVIYDKRASHRSCQTDLRWGQMAVGGASLGRNGDEGSDSDYILSGGPYGTGLFKMACGAVFTSIESFNAVTLFSDVETGRTAQGKIVDFIEIGASGAIGHSFEPFADASIDCEFLFYNLFADSDDDGFADMCFVEAAFSAIPYLSWSEVVIGDPLMRIAYGPGAPAFGEINGDLDFDGYSSTFSDLELFTESFLSGLYENSEIDHKYNDLCDVNRDMIINLEDFSILYP